jgi:FtsP/CotA-like multicopper oxidase with cupredoxin domain
MFPALLAALTLALQQPQSPPQSPPRSPSRSPSSLPPQSVVPARANDNRAKAGILYGSTLAVRIEARLAEWHPNGDDEPGAVVPAFAEQGRAPQIPGPLIRVPGGTALIVTVRNSIPNTTLTVHGLHVRPAIGPFFNDSIVLPPGAMETMRFRLDRPGTYYYWGTTTGRAFGNRTREDAQLTGAIVVDDPDARQPKDRILVIGMWSDTVGAAARHRARELFVVNGKAWPYSERLQFDRGDSVRMRVINASADLHAMHLHGYFFRVSRRGDGRADSLVTTHDVENTERMLPGETMTMAWNATRLGTWLFHCEIPSHYMPRGALGFPSVAGRGSQVPGVGANGSTIQVDHGMGGLVSAIEVKRGEDDTASVPGLANPARSLRVTLNPVAGSHYYSIGLQEGALGVESMPAPDVHAGPPIVLNRGEATQLLVFNRLPRPTSMHWHGLELDSFFDGVPGVSGTRPDTAGAIAPSDSFDARVTPPRTGTFMYHSHVDAVHQLRAGLVGPLLVVDKRAGPYDPTKEILYLVTSPADSVEEERAVLVNGMERPAAVELKKGGVYRLRVLNGTAGRPDLVVSFRDAEPADTAEATWRPLAKDGWDIPAAERTLRTSHRALTIGETADFELSAARVGDYRLEARAGDGTVLGALDLHVR